jgi:hypothetical protein
VTLLGRALGWLSRGLAGAALVVVVLAAAAGAAAPWSRTGWVLLAAAGLLAGGWMLGWGARGWMCALGAAVLAGVVAARLGAPGGGAASMITLPGGGPSRPLARLVDEQDPSLAGARLLAWRGALTSDERHRLPREMHDAYVEMRSELQPPPSPVLDTLLGRQTPAAFDTLVLEPARPAPGVGVVFLHGYAGSFTLECWLVAGAAQAIGAVTVCPAVDFSGHWGGRDGERTLGATLAYLHARGVRRVYLAGLSNGALGASALAPRFASSLAGLILISGAPAAGSDGGLPALVIHGDRDASASVRSARAFAARTGASYASFEGGHFVLLMRRAEVRAAIAGWLRRREEAR